MNHESGWDGKGIVASFGAEFTGAIGSVDLATTEPDSVVDGNRKYLVVSDCTSNLNAVLTQQLGWLSYRVCQRWSLLTV